MCIRDRSSGDCNSDNIYYKSPETLDGRIPTVASDIYALGVVAYQLLTGKLPFNGNTEREFLRSLKADLEILPTDIRYDISTDVDDVIEKALSKDPLGRYSTARDFGDALSAALAATPPTLIADEHITVLDEQPDRTKEGAIVPGSNRISIPATALSLIHISEPTRPY